MGKEYDFLTLDLFRSNHSVTNAMKLVIILRQILSKKGLTSSDDVMQWLGISKRTAQRYLNELKAHGLIEGDLRIPQGFKASEMGKQLFVVKIIHKDGDK